MEGGIIVNVGENNGQGAGGQPQNGQQPAEPPPPPPPQWCGKSDCFCRDCGISFRISNNITKIWVRILDHEAVISIVKAKTDILHSVTSVSRVAVGTNIMCVCTIPPNFFKKFKGWIRAKHVRACRLRTKEQEQLALLVWGPHTTPTLRQRAEATVAAMNPSERDLQGALDQLWETTSWPRCGTHVFASVYSDPLLEDILRFNLLGLNDLVCRKLPAHHDFLPNSIEAAKSAWSAAKDAFFEQADLHFRLKNEKYSELWFSDPTMRTADSRRLQRLGPKKREQVMTRIPKTNRIAIFRRFKSRVLLPLLAEQWATGTDEAGDTTN